MDHAREIDQSLKAKCPSCGRQHFAPSLSALLKQVNSCGCRSQGPEAVTRRGCAAPTTLPVQLRFGRAVLSQNKTSYSHWSRHHRDKKDWMSRVSVVGRALVGQRFGYSRWRLIRRYCPPRREYDHANLVGGAKPLIDCLVDCGIILDDKQTHFSCDYLQELSDRDETLLILEEVAHERPPT